MGNLPCVAPKKISVTTHKAVIDAALGDIRCALYDINLGDIARAVRTLEAARDNLVVEQEKAKNLIPNI